MSDTDTFPRRASGSNRSLTSEYADADLSRLTFSVYPAVIVDRPWQIVLWIM